jgi:DNA-binding NarL/FixJ family response regulator
MNRYTYLEKLPKDFLASEEVLYFPYIFDYRILSNFRKLVHEMVITKREAEILVLKAQGLDDVIIAKFFYISKNTVKASAFRTAKKLGFHYELISENDTKHVLTTVLYNWAFKDVNS